VDKPVVHYLGPAEFVPLGDDRFVARVYALDHPHLGETNVRTSVIVGDMDESRFETVNTVYIRKGN
jgi:hypothetical protein